MIAPRMRQRTRTGVRGPLVVLVCLLVRSSCAQNAAQFVTWGDNAMAIEDYYGASKFYTRAMEMEGGRLELQWKYAEAGRLSNQYSEAAAMYEKVYRKDQGRTYPDALRWLGEMYLCAGKYDEARKTWLKVKQKARDKQGTTAIRADNALAGIALAKERMAEPEDVTIEHLPEPVNSYDSEFGARTGPDGKLYLTSLRGAINADDEVIDSAHYVARIFHSDTTAGAWMVPQATDSIQPGVSMANPAWTPTGLYLASRCDPRRPCRIVIGRGVEERSLTGLGEAQSTQPMVANFQGKETLFFTSDRVGGAGGLDIWLADFDGDRVSIVRPLGPPINTPGNESCPYYDADQGKLYFSSDFHPGSGGFDNFMSRDSAGTFTAPVNLMYPLNSPANDLYPTFDLKTRTGYFTSNRVGSLAKKGATCCNDIYRYHYPALRLAQRDSTGTVRAQDSLPGEAPTVAEKRITSLREKLPIRLYFHNDEPGPRSRDTLTALTYEATWRAYRALRPDYHRAWQGDTTAIEAFFRDNVDAGLARLNEFTTLLRQALDEGQRIELRVRGFASPLAESDYNARLSLRRISSLVNQLRTTQGGALRPFLESGALRLVKSPFGEDRSATGVSDRLDDLQGSVYSVGAALERRIEIEQVMDAGAGAQPLSAPLTLDMGPLLQGMERADTVRVLNDTGTPVTLHGAQLDCDCFRVQVPDEPIAPGTIVGIHVTFTGRLRPGHVSREAIIPTSGGAAILRLTITGTVIPH